MIRTIIWFIYFFLYLFALTPMYLYCKHLNKKGEKEKAWTHIEKIVSRWAKRLLWLAGGKVIVTGEENIPEGIAVFVSNHQSNFDIPTVLAYTGKPRPLLAKVSLTKIPGIHGWMNLMGCVFVDRKDPKQTVRALMDSTHLVKEGQSMTIFPEGTRGKGGPMKEFKGGAFRVATQAKVPIVPITIDGTYHLLEEGNRIHPGTVHVTIHAPIETKGMDKQQIKDLPARVQEQIASALK